MVKKLHRKYKCVIYVVVQFYPLFWGMVMYDNDFEAKEIKFKPKININHNNRDQTEIVTQRME